MTGYHRLGTETVVAGESYEHVISVEDNGSAVDITGASVSYHVVPTIGAADSAAVFDGGDSDVSVSITDAAAGEVTVTVEQGVTDALGGNRYWRRLVVDDAGTGKQVFRDWLIIEFA